MRGLALCLAGGALLFAVLPAAALADGDFLAGAARVETTPPLAGSVPDLPAFSICPAEIYSGKRVFAFNEPYTDLDGNGSFSYPEPFCDANTNGRYDGIYSSGGVDHPAQRVHDPIDARALALSDGVRTSVIVSVVAQGLFENYTDAIKRAAIALRPGITNLIVSANHNESSPDTIGIYGAPAPDPAPAGLRSGIDDYYMTWLVAQVAQAAARAYDARRPASLWATQFQLPPDVRVRLSTTFPTTDNDGRPIATDPKVGVLQARDQAGKPIATVMSLAAHNQEIGHSAAATPGTPAFDISSDWPGYFHKALEDAGLGMGMFLVGDNGSEEDPETVPALDKSAGPNCPSGCYAQAKATGEALAAAVTSALPAVERLRSGPLVYDHSDFCVPLENNLFLAASLIGTFGQRTAWACSNGTPLTPVPVGNQFRTEVSVLDVGPDLQLIASPGEAFPALMVGSPWGYEDAGCPERANPPVPTWRGAARFRFQVGLADDMIGYLIPPWGFSEMVGVFPTTCVNSLDTGLDPAGHKHKLESESVGWSGAAAVASELTRLLLKRPDSTALVRPGRFVLADGSLSRKADGAVAVLEPDSGSTALSLSAGTLLGLPGVAGVGARAVDATADFMDFDGVRQKAADITTRGVAIGNSAGDVVARHYLDVYPPLTGGKLPAARTGVPVAKGRKRACGAGSRPRSFPETGSVVVSQGRLVLHGRSEGTCGRPSGRIARVAAYIARRAGHGCRFVGPNGRLGRRRDCRRPILLLARGRSRWTLSLRLHVPRGRYTLTVVATDAAGKRERPLRARDVVRVRVL